MKKKEPIGFNPEYSIYEKVDDYDDETDQDVTDYESEISEQDTETQTEFKNDEEDNKNYSFLNLKKTKKQNKQENKHVKLLDEEEYLSD